MSLPNPIDRVVGAIVPRAVDAVDVNEVLGEVDVDEVLRRVDVDEVVRRIDVNNVVERIDVDEVMEAVDVQRVVDRIDVDGVVARIDVDALIARVDPQVLLDRVDPDALVQRVDVDALVQRVDVNAMVDRVDVNALLDRLDPNALLARLDVDALLDRVDVERLVQRANIDQIVAEASKGAVTRTLDVARRQLAGLDLLMMGTVNRVLRRPRPVISTAESLSGETAGGVSRLVAFLLDAGAISLLYSALVALVLFLVELVTGDRAATSDHIEVGVGGAISFGFLYYWTLLTITGRSIGKAVVGLRVVTLGGHPISPGRAALRTIVYPFSFVLGLGLLPIVVGRHHRALHDLAGRDKVVYDWGDRPAELPAPVTAFVRRRTAARDLPPIA